MRSRTTGCGLARRARGWVYSRVLHATSSSPGAPAPSQARHHGHLALLLAALAALGPFSTDTYLPSFQEIGVEFGASQLLVQQTLTAYMVPFAAMTLWHGAISDALGRRRVTIVLLAMFALASVGCMCAWSVESLMLFRALQGMSAGAGMIIGRAVVRDIFDGTEARRMMGQVAIMFAVAPALGPVVGGWLHVWFGWRSVFAFLALFSALLCWWCCKELPETLPPEKRQPFHPKPLAQGYWEAIRSGPFVALVLAITLNFSATFTYIVSAPAFVIGQLHLNETSFLWLFGPITCGFLIGAYLSSRLAGHLSNRKTVALSYAIMAGAALANLLFHAFFPPMTPWSVLPLAIYSVGTSLAMPSLTLMALDLLPQRRGLAASCQGFVQSAGNAVVTASIAPLVWGSAFTMSVNMVALMTLGGGMFLLAVALHRRAARHLA
ncbi:MAG: Bicyclomycin resistance protein [Verrucomicrobia bacterium ADurb.Bin122]|nr:MAG: Bicyclomycin resistance protein [Verrucomicrobia bacterium ADurb.Bin122]